MAEKHDDTSPDDVQPRLLLLHYPAKATTILQHPGKATSILPLPHCVFHVGCETSASLKEWVGRVESTILLLSAKYFRSIDMASVLPSGALI